MEELKSFLASCEFGSPLYFWIGAVLALLLIFFPLRGKANALAMDLHYWQPRVALKSTGVWVLSLLVAIISVLLAGVLSTPEVTSKTSVSLAGKPVLAIVDVSGSMGVPPTAKDAPGADTRTNYEKARSVFDDLISRWPDVDFGLLMYSTENYVARYFAYKNELLKDSMENQSEIDFISSGTRPVEALFKARKFFTDKVKGQDKTIVLITDLDVDLVTMMGIVEEIQKDILANIKVYVIQVGGDPQPGAHWDPNAANTKQTLPIVSMYDKEGIDQVCKQISEMQAAPLEQEQVLQKSSLIPFLIAPIVGLVLMLLVLSETRFRKIP